MTHPTNQANQAVPASQPASLPASQPASQPASLPASQPKHKKGTAKKWRELLPGGPIGPPGWPLASEYISPNIKYQVSGIFLLLPLTAQDPRYPKRQLSLTVILLKR